MILSQVQKLELFFVTSAKPLTESGIMCCYLNLWQLVSLGMCLHALTVNFPTGMRCIKLGLYSQCCFPGLILGPLLVFQILNDIVLNIRSNKRLFVDGTALYIIVDNPIPATGLNIDLETIPKCAET